MRLRDALLILSLLTLLLFSARLWADRLTLKNGKEVEGTIEFGQLRITSDSGIIEIPESSISEITTMEGAIDVLLSDGTHLIGSPVEAEVILRVELFSRRIAWPDIRRIAMEKRAIAVPAEESTSQRRTVDIPPGTEVPLQVAQIVSSSGATPGTEVLFCVNQDVTVGQEVVISAGTPALGEVAAVQRRGRLVIEVKRTFAVDGQDVPLRSQMAFDGETTFNVGAVIMLGAPGIPAGFEKGQAISTTGAVLEAATEGKVTLWSRPARSADLQRQLKPRCDDFFSFRNTPGFFRVDPSDTSTAYAPVSSPMRLEIPADPLPLSKEGSSWRIPYLHRFYCSDATIRTMEIKLDTLKKDVAVFEIRTDIWVQPSIWKYVDLRFDLLAGEETVGTASTAGIEADDGDLTITKTRMAVSIASLDKLREAGHARSLRIAMFVQNGE